MESEKRVEVRGRLVYVDGKMVKGTIEEVKLALSEGRMPVQETEGVAMGRVAAELGFNFASVSPAPPAGEAGRATN